MAKASGAKKLLIVTIFGALAATLVALWKASKPVEDPWENPAPQPQTQHPVPEREVSIDEVREALKDVK